MAIVDGDKGKLFLDPDQDFLEKYTKEQNAEPGKTEDWSHRLKGKGTVTKGGRRIELFANIGSGEDVDAVLDNDGEGIGLFRSEFLYLGKEQLPSEEEQFQIYKNVAKRMGDEKGNYTYIGSWSRQAGTLLSNGKGRESGYGLQEESGCVWNIPRLSNLS